MAQKIWIDGQFVSKENATVNVYDHGLLYGDGIFEGIRIYNNRIFKLQTHLKRLYKSAQAIRLTIPYTIEEFTKHTQETVAKNNLQKRLYPHPRHTRHRRSLTKPLLMPKPRRHHYRRRGSTLSR